MNYSPAPARLRYESIRDSLTAEYETQGHISLQTLSNWTLIIWGLKHLTKFFAGHKVMVISLDTRREFISHRQLREANPATIIVCRLAIKPD